MSVMQWVLAVRETVVIKPSRINIVAQALYLLFLHPFPSLALIHTPLFGWALIRLQASGLAQSITRKRLVAQHLHFTHIVTQASGFALHYTCFTAEVVHWARHLRSLQHWYMKSARTTL